MVKKMIKVVIIILIVFILGKIIRYFYIKTSNGSDIENVTVYEKKRVINLLKEQYTEDEFEIICYLCDIMKGTSKWSPIDKQLGKELMVRPNEQVGEEFIVRYDLNQIM